MTKIILIISFMNGNFSVELIRLLHPLYFPTIKIMGKLNLFEEKNSKPFLFLCLHNERKDIVTTLKLVDVNG